MLTRPCVRACALPGVLAVCLNVDYRILFTPPTEGVVRDGFEFYATFYNAPPAIKVCVVFRTSSSDSAPR